MPEISARTGVRINAAQMITDEFLAQGPSDIRDYVERLLSLAFAEVLADAHRNLGPILIGPLHNEVRRDPLMLSQEFERWCYVWPVPLEMRDRLP